MPKIPVREFEELKEQKDKASVPPGGNYIRQSIPKEYDMDDFPEIKLKIDICRDLLIDDMADPFKAEITKE
jgi:hypothetical protein